jgi:hypothetical protein
LFLSQYIILGVTLVGQLRRNNVFNPHVKGQPAPLFK